MVPVQVNFVAQSTCFTAAFWSLVPSVCTSFLFLVSMTPLHGRLMMQRAIPSLSLHRHWVLRIRALIAVPFLISTEWAPAAAAQWKLSSMKFSQRLDSSMPSISGFPKWDLHIISITSSLGSFMTKFAELGQNLGALAGRGLYAVSLH